MNVIPATGVPVLKYWRPDVLLVEASWNGLWNAWRYKIASYPDHPERHNGALRALVEFAREKRIPTVFWNREDGVHFNRFIESAKLFEYILTVDDTTIARYKEMVPSGTIIGVMMFAVQPALHFRAPSDLNRCCAFVGSYDRSIHPTRRQWLDMIFDASADLGVTVYDRNSSRRPERYRFPSRPWIDVRPSISHKDTAKVYRNFMCNINVNTIQGSRTAFSRRLVEILACGGLVATNPTLAVKELFAEYCEVISQESEAQALFEKLYKDGWSGRQREMAASGAEYVLKHHTWAHRLEEIVDFIKLDRR